MSKKRKRYNSQEKMTILRKHLLEGVPVSDVCDEYGIQPSVFYRWQKLLFEQGGQPRAGPTYNSLPLRAQHAVGVKGGAHPTAAARPRDSCSATHRSG